jgi:hypothetical protein
MLRKSGPSWAAVLILFAGCDFFSTREILPKPSDIRSFQGLSKAGDSLAFRVTESLRAPGASTDKQVLSKRKLTFTFQGDSLVGGDTLKVVALRISEDPSGYVLEQSVRLLRFSADGLLFEGAASGGGARFYPLKTSAVQDTAIYLALPAVFSEGWSLTQAMGVLNVRRDLSGSDTLPYHGHSEVSWKIAESVMDADSVLAKGQYWYGVSGLLKAEQTWPDFDWREANASSPGAVDLHRGLERL